MLTSPRFAVVVALGVAGLLLTGCAPDDHALTPGAASPSSTQSATPTGEGTFDPDSDPVNETVGINCQQFVSDQAVYDWGSGNFALDVDYTPAPGSSAAEAVAAGGLAFIWVNLTSAETVDIAVSIPQPADLATARATAEAAGEPAPLVSGDAYFSPGHVDAFTDKYWVTADSTWFASEEDAAPLIAAALDALGG